MSVLGTICYLQDFAYVDRWGQRIETILADVHVATTDSKYLHFSIEHYFGDNTTHLEVQLNAEQAMELGNALMTWAKNQDKKNLRGK